MAKYDDKVWEAMNDSTISKADNLIPKEKKYDWSGYGRDEEGVRYSAYVNLDDKTMYWQHPTNKLLYDSKGIRSGYIGENDKAHFGFPKFDPLQVKDDAGNIISERVIKPGSLEHQLNTTKDVGPISNKYLTAKEGQKYYGFSFPKGM